MCPTLRSIILASILCCSGLLMAEPPEIDEAISVVGIDIEVLALFADAALLRIDGKQQFLKAGERSPQGVLLVRASSQRATIGYRGVDSELSISQRISTHYKKAEHRSVSIQVNSHGQYKTTGSINDRPVGFLVDTGANIVAMSSVAAKALGIDLADSRPMQVTTASGKLLSRQVVLDSVQVGDIRVLNVSAAVIDGDYPVDILLGMSYLKSVKIQEEAGLMVLSRQF